MAPSYQYIENRLDPSLTDVTRKMPVLIDIIHQPHLSYGWVVFPYVVISGMTYETENEMHYVKVKWGSPEEIAFLVPHAASVVTSSSQRPKVKGEIKLFSTSYIHNERYNRCFIEYVWWRLESTETYTRCSRSRPILYMFDPQYISTWISLNECICLIWKTQQFLVN